jgi:predicted Zn-ribbon and HTH transcriptional regulator
MARKSPATPRERAETIRQALLASLRDGPATARELSALVSIREKEVAEHLAHLQRSLRRTDERLVVEPAECLACGYAFTRRTRLTRPSACPRCKAERIEPPVFRIESDAD